MIKKHFFWDIMSNAWDNLKEKELFEVLWVAYSRSFYTGQLSLYQSDLGKSIVNILPWTKYVWLCFDFDSSTYIDSTTYSTDDSSILYIPYLQDGIDIYNNRYINGVDYTTSSPSGSPVEIIWTTSNDSTRLWAPIVYKNHNRIANNWGILIGEESSDSTEYLDAVSGAIYSYWRGPTRRDIRNGLNIFYGLDFIDRDGIVFDIDSTSITIKHGREDYSIYTFDDTEETPYKKGDEVHKYDAVTNSIEILDYITHPRWWKTYSIDLINKNFYGEVLTDNQKNKINELSQYFTFGIKIDAEKYSNLNLLIPGMAVRFIDKIKPSYSDYFFIIYNDFRSINPDDSNGDWIFLRDDISDSSIGISEEWELFLNQRFGSNYTHYIWGIDGFEASEPLTFDQYQSTSREAYDIDSDSIVFWEKLEIL